MSLTYASPNFVRAEQEPDPNASDEVLEPSPEDEPAEPEPDAPLDAGSDEPEAGPASDEE